MNAVKSFNDIIQAIDFASVDATDEKPLVAVMAFTPSNGWTFVASQDEKDVQNVCKAFPIIASTQGIEIKEPPMTIERAKRIVKDMLSISMLTHGVGDRDKMASIKEYSLREMLDANEMLEGYTEDGDKPGWKRTFMKIDPRGIAALYCWEHFPPDFDETCTPLVHAKYKVLALVRTEKQDGLDYEDE